MKSIYPVKPGNNELRSCHDEVTFYNGGPTAPGFNGEIHEATTGWQILGNGYRVYNPVLMRFHSPDNLSPFDKGGLNAYMYCGGDPVNTTDPTGHAIKLQLSLGNYFFKGSKRLESAAFQQSRVINMVDDNAMSVIKVAAKSEIDTVKALKARHLEELGALEGRLKNLTPHARAPEKLLANTRERFNKLYAEAQGRYQKVTAYSYYLESVEQHPGGLYITENARKFLFGKALKIRELEEWSAARLHQGANQGKLKVD